MGAALKVQGCSGDQVVDDAAVDVGQAEVAAGVAVGELRVVEAEQVQDGGVQVVDVDRVLDGLEAEFVGRAVGWPPLTPPPASQTVKPQWLWSRPLILPWLAPALGSSTTGVRPNSPPQMTSVSSNSPRCLRSVEQGGDGLVALLGQAAVVDFEVVVAVPRLAVAVLDLHEAHAALDQAAGDQHLPGLRASP